MPDDPAPLAVAAIARLVGGDPLAPVLIAAAAEAHPDSFAAAAALALLVPEAEDAWLRARRLARSRREHQHLAILEVWRHGDRSRAALLAREHLAEFPGDLLVSWLAGR